MKRVFYLSVILALCAETTFAQQWFYTGSMQTARRLHSCAVLNDGRVLVAGGSDSRGIALSSAELYDPATSTWSAGQDMEVPRERQATVTGADGTVYVIGGNTANTSSSVLTTSIEAFDPSTNGWHHVADLLLARQNHTATLLNDSTILIAGGYTGDFIAECEIFDPRTGSVRKAASMNVGRHDHAAILLSSGRVLVLGGRIGGAGGPYLNSCEIYDPTTDMWTVTEQMLSPRISASVVELSDKSILVSGGRNSPNTIASDVERYDETSGHWSAVAPILKPCNWQAGIQMPGDRYMITGGYSGGDLSTNTILYSTPTCEWFDRHYSAWFYAPTMNLLRSEHGGVYMHQSVNEALPHDMLLVTGGITYSNTFTNSCEVLDVTEQALQTYRVNQPTSTVLQSIENGAFAIENTAGGVDILINAGSSEPCEIGIYASSGQMVWKNTVSLSPGEHRVDLSTSSLESGMYFVRVIQAGQLFSASFVRMR